MDDESYRLGINRLQYACITGMMGQRHNTELVSWNQSSFTKSSNRRQDFVSGFSPNERLGMFVVSFDIVSNSGFEFAGATEYTSSNLFFREQREPALHQIDPGSSGWSKVQMKTRSFEQPALDRR